MPASETVYNIARQLQNVITVDANLRHSVQTLKFAHDHPSGDPTPSKEDIRNAHQLQAAGHILKKELLDHLVSGKDLFKSILHS